MKTKQQAYVQRTNIFNQNSNRKMFEYWWPAVKHLSALKVGSGP